MTVSTERTRMDRIVVALRAANARGYRFPFDTATALEVELERHGLRIQWIPGRKPSPEK